MHSRLAGIRDWDDRALVAGYSVDRLAQGAGISRQHLNRFCRTLFGLSAHQWLGRMRMEKARDLLSERSTIKETAAALGYSHAANFARAFRQAHGMAPSESRVLPVTAEVVASNISAADRNPGRVRAGVPK